MTIQFGRGGLGFTSAPGFVGTLAPQNTAVNMIALKAQSAVANTAIHLLGFYDETDKGGGTFYWDAAEDKANHDGGLIIDPTHSAIPGDPAWYSDDNVGTGCWKRVWASPMIPEWFGDNLPALFARASTHNVSIQFVTAKTYDCPTSIVGTWASSVTIDFGPAIMNATASIYSFFSLTCTEGTLTFLNFKGLANQLVRRGVQLTSGSIKGNIVVKGYYIKQVYHASSPFGIFLYGPGANARIEDFYLDELSSPIGGSPTTGIQMGTNDYPFENNYINNAFFYNMSEQDGTSTADSDCIKIFGAMHNIKTQAFVSNISSINDGHSVKRIIKLQVDNYYIANVDIKVSNCTLYSAVETQGGAGTTEGVRIIAVNTAISTLIANNIRRLGLSEDCGNVIVRNVYASGDVNSRINHRCFYSRHDVPLGSPQVQMRFENIRVEGFGASTLTDFILTGTVSNKNTYVFKDIDCIDGPLPSRGFNSGGAVGDVTVRRNTAILENVRFSAPLVLNCAYASNAQTYNAFIPLKMIGCNLLCRSSEADKRLQISRFPEVQNGVYRYLWDTAPVGDDGASSNNATTLYLPEGLNRNTLFQMRFSIGREGNQVIYDVYVTTDPLALHHSVLFSTGTAQMHSPTVAWDSVTNYLTISWGYAHSASLGHRLEITSGQYFEVVRAMGRYTVNTL